MVTMSKTVHAVLKEPDRRSLPSSAAAVRGRRRWLRIPAVAAVAVTGTGLALLVACDFDEARALPFTRLAVSYHNNAAGIIFTQQLSHAWSLEEAGKR